MKRGCYEAQPLGVFGVGGAGCTDFPAHEDVSPLKAATLCCCLTRYKDPAVASTEAGNTLTVRGVITAHTPNSLNTAANGFFIQTDGPGDGDPDTSEGLFVHDPAMSLGTQFGTGTIVLVTGTVEEFGAAGQATVTRLAATLVTPDGTADVPEPVLLTGQELSPDGPSDQLERFEGMRVTVASLRAVSGTGLDGSFYAMLHDPASPDAARPFREPGIEVGAPALDCAVGPCDFESFDGNPERLRVDSDGLAGTMPVQCRPVP